MRTDRMRLSAFNALRGELTQLRSLLLVQEPGWQFIVLRDDAWRSILATSDVVADELSERLFSIYTKVARLNAQTQELLALRSGGASQVHLADEIRGLENQRRDDGVRLAAEIENVLVELRVEA
jgi:hypothetical protein